MNAWLAKRNDERSSWADVRQFASFEAAGEWLLLSVEDTAALKAGDSFTEITRFKAAPSLSR